MRLALFTTIPSHYQIALAKAFYDQLGTDFSLICWEPVVQEYQRLGWRQDYSPDWLIKAWQSEDQGREAVELLRSAKVVIWGKAPIEEIQQRVVSGKLTFRYTERLFKRGRWRILDPRVFGALRNTYYRTNAYSHHLLAVGPYCADDFRFIRMFSGRMWRWGYFPDVPASIQEKKISDCPTVLWAGRMVSWKRVDLLLEAAAWARKHGCRSFRLTLIGYGPEEERLRLLAAQLGLMDMCAFQKPQTPEEVGKSMEEADIYVLPSDQQEGWGVVVNEAMSRGCCVIGSKSAGSVPWLIRDGVNGYPFDGSSADSLGQVLQRCIENPERTRDIGAAAYITVANQWSPIVAAERFLQLCECIERREPSPFDDSGPCSPA